MRKFLTICAILLSLSASAQWQQTGSRVRYVNGIGIPTRDTSAMTPADSSQILIRPADSSLYVRYKRAWMRVGGGGGSIAGSGTTNYVPKFTSSTAIGNSQIFDNGTSVGIGTTSPNTRLHTTGSLTVNDIIYLQRSSSSLFLPIANYWDGAGNPLAGTKGDILAIGNAGGDGLVFVNSNTERMRITSAGNVGIGTTSPSEKLTVTGNGTFSGSLTSGGLLITNNRLWISANNPISDWISSSLTAGYSATNSYGWLNSANNLVLGTDGSERMRITSAGNVGIGTTSPVSRLDVSGTATATNLSVTTNATVGGTLRVTGTTTLGTTNTGAINAASVDAGTGNGSFGNVYSGGIVQMLGVNVKYRNISATYTATTSDDYFINITSGTFTLNLPTAATPYGQVYVIKNSGTGTVTVDPNGSQTIDGATTFTMNVQNGSITIIGDGTNWKIVSKYL
jgi:hypothetical protein